MIYATGNMTAKQAREAALNLCLGKYQRDIVLGRESLSGASLSGEARFWGGRYAASRAAILRRIDDADIPVIQVRGRHGRLFLLWGTENVSKARIAKAELKQALLDHPGESRAARAARTAARIVYFSATRP